MSTRRIIPCLDVKDGRVVKGCGFAQLKDAGDPVELAEYYCRSGADELVFLDITATVEGRGTIIEVVGRVAEKISIPLIVGGGLRTPADIRCLLQAGAAKVSLGTAAVRRPEIISEGAAAFGKGCIVAAIDAGRDDASPSGWRVYIMGGREPAGLDAVAWAQRAAALGAGEILLTSIDADGYRAGYDVELTRAVAEAVSVPVIASGGAGSLEDLYRALSDGRADAVLAASIFHYGTHTIAEAKQYLKDRGVPVRL